MKIFQSKIILIIILELFIISILIKATSINTLYIDHDNTFYYRVFQSIANDSLICFLVLFLSYLSYQSFIPKIVSIFLRILSFAIFLFYIVDIIILFKFANHLVLNDLIKYLLYAPKYIEQLYGFNILYFLPIFLILFLFIYFIFYSLKIEKKSTHLYFNISFLILLSLYFTADKGRFIHSWLYKNFITYNIEIYDQSKPYSKSFIENLNYKEKFTCRQQEEQRPNIIILMVESLASYQSQYFSGIKNWTPNLDKIAKKNISFKNFYANGFVTEDAEISILLGELPIYAPKVYSNGGGVSFEGFYNKKNSLANILKIKNYSTEFITSSDLEFSNTGKWAQSIGFNYIEGSEHPYYKAKQRYHFEAAEDKYLYHRVLNRLDKQKSNFFLFVKTVSSHAPFINPENNSSSEEETIKYMDKQIGVFYKELEKRDFFKDGLLIIVGDHHPIIPLRKEELKLLGEYSSSSLLPMIVSYKNKKELIKTQFQQTDIFNSIKNLVSKEKCTSAWLGDFLSDNKINADFISHRRGDQRGVVSVFSKEKDFNIKLYGDKTHFISKEKDDLILDKINFSRIQKLNEKYKSNLQ